MKNTRLPAAPSTSSASTLIQPKKTLPILLGRLHPTAENPDPVSAQRLQPAGLQALQPKISMSKLDDNITYELFKNLEQDPHLSQRALSRILGISLGKVNYCLKALIAKGWV